MLENIVDTWIEEGIQQGIQKGIQQGKERVVRHLLREGDFSHEKIASLAEVDLSRVREIAESLGQGS